MSNIKPETLEALRRALEGKQIRASHDPDVGWHDEPDPAYAPLLALVREPCNGVHPETNKMNVSYSKRCSEVGCSGYITCTAYWQAAPEGALRGAVKEAVRRQARQGNHSFQVFYNRLLESEWFTDNPDQATLEAVLAWVQGEP